MEDTGFVAPAIELIGVSLMWAALLANLPNPIWWLGFILWVLGFGLWMVERYA